MARKIKGKYIISFDGTRVHYIYKKNNKVCLVFLHGLGAGYLAWKPMYTFFHNKSYSILSIDIRGHGYSDKPKGKQKYTLKNAARDIEEIIKREKIKELILVGHSFGCYLSLKLYSLFPQRIKKMVLISGHFYPKKDIRYIIGGKVFLSYVFFVSLLNKKEYFTQIDFTKYRGRSDIDLPKIYYEIKTASSKTYFPYVNEVLNFDGEAICRNIKIPVLIIQGKKDICVRPKVAEEMSQVIPNSKLVYLESINHHAPVNCPEKLNDIILRFI